jgi:predicted kinase
MSFQRLIDKFPKEVVDKLRTTEQNPNWHPEISVYNHLYIVYESIRLSNLEDGLKQDLMLCAIFHDLGKCDVTRLKECSDGTSKLVSYGHENLAKTYLDKYLNRFIVNDKALIYEVCANHMRAHLYEELSEKKKIKFQNNRYFKETMEFSKHDEMLDKKVPYFTMLIGIPGSGKSSFITKEQHYGDKNYEIVCPDLIRKEVTGQISDISQDFKVWQITKERVLKYLSEGKNVVLDSTMTISKRRKEFIKDLPLCFRYAKIFECSPEIAKERIKKDIENGIDRSNVPEEIIDKMHANFVRDIDKLNEDGFEILE